MSGSRAPPADRRRKLAMMEVRVEDCLQRSDSSGLVSVLRAEGLGGATLTRLDRLVAKDLSGPGLGRVLVLVRALEALSESRDALQTLLQHGLTAKLLSWFEVVHDLLTSDITRSSDPLLSLTEEFYDYFLLLAQASLPVSQLSVVLLQLVRFSLDQEVHFPLRLEAIRTFNSILESLNREERRRIQKDQNQTQTQSQMAAAVLTVGDYELQVSLSEALCRLTPRKDREQRANQWFSSRDISSAFCDIRDGDFEVDCRSFLNFVNRYLGDQRRVYTLPCLRAFLDSTELFRPKDDKLDEFWVDFNLSSGCVSFFIDEPQGFLWGSVHLLKQEVDHYSVAVTECTGAQTVLTVRLINPIMHHNSQGQTVELSFSCEHQRELEEAAGRVFTQSERSPPLPGSAALPPPAGRQSHCYGRKRRQNRSQLRVLPLSSPSSGEDASLTKVGDRRRSDSLFDHVRHSTSSYDSGVPVGAEPETSQEQTEDFGGSSSPLKKDGFISERKRVAPPSGYLSDQSEGLPACKRGAGPRSQGEGPDSPVTGSPPQGAEPQPEEALGAAGAWPQSDITADITAAFNSFKTQLEEQLTGCWQEAESQVLLSLKTFQQQVSTLLTAVHHHRCLSLQTFLISVTDQLDRLKETSADLNAISSHFLSFFQSEMQRLGSFCDQQLDRLKTSGVERPSSQ